MADEEDATSPPPGERRTGKDRRRWDRIGAPDRRQGPDRRKHDVPGSPKRRSTDPK